jgi:gliding motility-associated-like protein
MYKRAGWLILILSFLFCSKVYCQQDVQFQLSAHLLTGKKILKIKHDISDIYLWVLAQSNEVYRVNTETLAVDDYTPQFAAYNSYNFIDIAGHGPDTVFIATNAVAVATYKSGAVALIGATDGLVGPVNSIGFWGTDYPDLGYAHRLLIGSANGMREYDTNLDQVQLPSGFDEGSTNKSSKIFEATYRTVLYTDGIPLGSGPIQSQPIWATAPDMGVYVGYIWIGGSQFGNNLNTAEMITYALGMPDNIGSFNYFWGTDNGMFQLRYEDGNNTPAYINQHYLDKIKVNKIANIYGLTAFQQNAGEYTTGDLIKQNLLIGTDNGFYFSSSIYPFASPIIPPFSLFNDPDIGNQPVNDIAVNQVVNGEPLCENGVWLAANDGLYLLKPNYAPYLQNQTTQAISFQNMGQNVSEMQICAGSGINAQVNYTNGTTVQWFKDGVELVDSTGRTLFINLAGTYYATIYDACSGGHIQSNQLKVDVISTPTFTFNYPDELDYCAGTMVTLTAQGSSSYQYRWYRNDTLNNLTTSSISVTQPGEYKVEVSACPNSWIPSKEVQVNFIQLPVPVITANKSAWCIGDNATLTLNLTPDPYYNINWYRDNVLLPGYASQYAITTNIAGNYTAVITSTATNTDGSVCSQTSNVQTITFDPEPTLSIQQMVNTTLCQGQTVGLKAVYSSGTIKWSTGETTDEIAVTASGVYMVTLTTESGCTKEDSTNVAFLPNPVLSVNDTTICTYKNQTITLSAPAGFAKYTWNNVPGNQTYNVTYPQTVSLTITDANGCQTTQQIHITEQCPDVEIPNTFTPNGDGINDTWDVQGLDNTSTVKIFNRYGSLLYQSKGYTTPWNGTYHNQKLPTGAYYYIITTKNNTQTYSGPVTVIY